MQTLERGVYSDLEDIARKRGITLQQLLRGVVIPEWYQDHHNSPDNPEYVGRKGKHAGQKPFKRRYGH